MTSLGNTLRADGLPGGTALPGNCAFDVGMPEIEMDLDHRFEEARMFMQASGLPQARVEAIFGVSLGCEQGET